MTDRGTATLPGHDDRQALVSQMTRHIDRMEPYCADTLWHGVARRLFAMAVIALEKALETRPGNVVEVRP